MITRFAVSAAICISLSACWALADENSKDAPGGEKAQRETAAPAKYEGDINDADALFKFAVTRFRAISSLIDADPDSAEAQIAEFEKTFQQLKVEDAKAKDVIRQVEGAAKALRGRLELARISMDDLKKTLQEEPSPKAVSQLIAKVTQQVRPLTRSEPDKAEAILDDARKLLDEVKESSASDDVKQAIDRSSRTFASLERSIESGKRIAAVIGKDAAPLEMEAWVNGEALGEGDLKGKVVLLDFWAVWCGPCIATFPHLREWHEKYADKGLHIIGVTSYYNMSWDDEAGRAKRAPRGEEVSAEDEQQMLVKFAEEHNLKHRFAIQSKDKVLSKYYAVSGIPHVVLIDREGKVRMIRVGSGEANAKEIGEMIDKLIAG